ncbi:amino acid ABC transporter substrate-binding protein [Pseudomonas stutzeri]|nr:transporter substrate-binding domain-containing protein [Stutzerimonas stutzeri]MBA1261915.1 amino acid ABC transporter substrate-binding protein [Stutzerimonas stutzeri]
MLAAVPVMAEQWTFVTEDFPPFTHPAEDVGSLEVGVLAGGPLVEIVQSACARLDRECPIMLHPWQRALRMAEQGEADGIFTVIRSPDRERAFHISRMLVMSRYSVFARDDSNFIFSDPDDLMGRTVGVYGPSGTSWVLSEHLKSIADVRIHLTLNNRRLLNMLQSGRFGKEGLAVVNQDVAWHLIEDEQLDGLREAGELAVVHYGIGLSRKRISEEQFQAFEQALDAAIADGTVPRILRRYQLEAAYP